MTTAAAFSAATFWILVQFGNGNMLHLCSFTSMWWTLESHLKHSRWILKEEAPTEHPGLLCISDRMNRKYPRSTWVSSACMYSKITLVGLSALIVSPEISSYPSVRDWGKSLFAQKQPKCVCAHGRVARQALQKVGWCTSPYPTSLEPLVQL